jgi:hypothetical protein
MPDRSNQIVHERLERKAAELNEAARTLPHGAEREGLQHRARRMENASLIIDTWLSSPRLCWFR